MKIISFRGGLGNQVFQYLFYLYIKDKYKKEKIYGYYNHANSHNGLEINNWFCVSLPKQKWFVRVLRQVIYLPQHLHVKKTVIDDDHYNHNGILYEGWWQNRDVFMPYIKELNYVKELNLSEKNRNLAHEIEKTESVAIHIRRGDYLLPQFAPRYANICTVEYYQKAIDLIKTKISNYKFFIFSDDTNWVKDNLKLNDAIYVDWNRGKDSFFDMYLMSQCKHHIIANSSFSLIGALMSKHQSQINICPQKWLNEGFKSPNIQPENWIKL